MYPRPIFCQPEAVFPAGPPPGSGSANCLSLPAPAAAPPPGDWLSRQLPVPFAIQFRLSFQALPPPEGEGELAEGV